MAVQGLEHSLVVANLLYCSGFVGGGLLVFFQRQDLGTKGSKSQNNTLPSESRVFMQVLCQSHLLEPF